MIVFCVMTLMLQTLSSNRIVSMSQLFRKTEVPHNEYGEEGGLKCNRDTRTAEANPPVLPSDASAISSDHS